MLKHDPYSLMITPPNKKTEMIIEEIKKKTPNLNLVKDLITLGANLEWRDEEDCECNLLHICAQYNSKKIAKLLLESGVNPNVLDSNHYTPLHYASANNSTDIALFLIKLGSDINARNECGFTPLHEAVDWIHDGMVTLLVKNGADLNVQDENGMTALHISAKDDLPDIVEILVDAGADKTIRDNEGMLAYDHYLKLKDILKP